MSTVRATLPDFIPPRESRRLPRMTEQQFVEWCTPDTWAEWVDGEVIIMSPIGREHSRVLMFFLHLLRAFVDENDLGEVLGEPFQVRFARQQRRRAPDLLYVSPSRRHIISEFHTEGAPDLIIEVVSPESQSRDRREKFLEYEAAGVREYWIVDPDSRTVEAYILGKNRKYTLITLKDGQIRSKVLHGFLIDPQWLWQERFPKVSTLLRQMRPRKRRK